MSAAASRRGAWSRWSIALHWLIAALFVVQIVNHDAMLAFWRPDDGGGAEAGAASLVVWSHVAAGSIILVAALFRLLDRLKRGRPPYPARDPDWATGLAKATHALLYAILVAMPLLGLAAWVTGSAMAGRAHSLLWLPFVGLVVLHVAGSLAQHFVFRTSVLRRMLPRVPRLRRRRA